MQLVGIITACAILVVVVAAYWYFFDSANIDTEEEAEVEETETPEERAAVIAKHREEIAEAEERQVTEMYSENE